ncbi:hypothetical protein BDAP_002888 [Binucleata daphniae]
MMQQDVLKGIIKVIRDNVQRNSIADINQMAKTIQAAQITYQHLTHKIKIVSTWHENICKKIDKYKRYIAILDESIKMKKLTKEDKRDISTYLKQEKLKLGNNCDAKDGISR